MHPSCKNHAFWCAFCYYRNNSSRHSTNDFANFHNNKF
nr:MAG TPA: coiled coil protein [Caudoviricetes sp.]